MKTLSLQTSIRELTLISTILCAGLLALPAAPLYGAGGDIIWQYGDSLSTNLQLAVDGVVDQSDGSVFVTGTGSNDYYTIKINPTGNDTLWYKTFDLNGGDDQAKAIVIDSKGHVVVTGTAFNGNSNDIVTIKYCGRTVVEKPGIPGGDPDACNAGDVIWQATFDGAAGGHDNAYDLTVDQDDNIYVGGKSQSLTGDYDYKLLKYYSTGPTTSGAPAWQRTYNGTGSDNDYITTVDAVSYGGGTYVVVTGNMKNNDATKNLDMHTKVYDSGGTLLWSATVTTPNGGNDFAVKAKFDATGNVYLTGYKDLTSRDIYTVKYNTSGTVVWQTTYSTANTDEPTDMDIDPGGDIYVTGKTYVNLQDYNFFTARYAAGNGSEVWSSIYNSPSNDEDDAIAIVVDHLETGGIFVTGTTYDNNNDFDIRTIKYEKSSGNIVWNDIFDGAVGSKNDAPVTIGQGTTDGGIYVIGYSDYYTAGASDLNYYTIKYDPGLLDPPTGLVATTLSDTNIQLTWSDNTTNETGFEIHRSTVPFAVSNDSLLTTVSANATAYNDSTVTAHTRYYYRIRAYTATDFSYESNQATALATILNYPTPAWLFTYDSSSGANYFNDKALAIAVGPDNHPVVSGYNNDLTNSNDFYTIKLNRVPLDNDAIKMEWADYADPSEGQMDQAYAMVVDDNDEVIVTGYGQMAFNNNIYTVKYPATGLYKCCSGWIDPPIWDDTYNGPGSDSDYPVAMALSPDGVTTAVAGYGVNADGAIDIYTLKFNYSDGGGAQAADRAWAMVYSAGTGKYDYPTDIIFDSSGNIIVTGMCNGNNVMTTGTFDIFVRKYSSSTGTALWTKCYDYSGGDDRAHSVAIDDNDNVYITGYVTSGGDKDYYTAKLQAGDGTTMWSKTYDGPGNGNDIAEVVRFDVNNGGEAVVGGTRLTSTGIDDFYILRYDSADGTVNLDIVLDREFDDDHLKVMEMDPTGNVCVAGITGTGGSADIIGVKYAYNGEIIGSFRYNGSGSNLDEPNAITVNTLGEMYVAGVTTNNSTVNNNDYIVLKCEGDVLQAPSPFNAAAYYTSTDLTWRDTTYDETAFKIQRKQDICLNNDSGNWIDVVTLGPDNDSYTDLGPNNSGILTGTTYCYRLQTNRNDEGSRWLEQQITTITPPPPTGLSGAGVATTVVDLDWTDNTTGETQFAIYRCAGTGCNDSYQFVDYAPGNTLTHFDTTVCEGTDYTYRILARNNDSNTWESAWSNYAVDVTTQSKAAVSGLAAVRSSEGRLDISWSDTNIDESGFTVYRCQGGSCTDYAPLANIESNSTTEAVAYYHLENIWTGSAGEVVDTTGHGHAGTANGGAFTAPGGRFGRTGSFDGIDDSITLTPATSYLADVTDGSFTFSAWVKPASTPPNTSTNDSAYSIIGRTGNNMSLFYNAANNFGLTVRNSTNTAFTTTSSGTYPANTDWHHVAGVTDTAASRIYLYVDGELQGNDTFTGPLKDYGTATYHIGAASLTGDYKYLYHGFIDEAAIFNQALSASEIYELANTYYPLTVSDMVMHLAMNEASWNGTVDEVKDFSTAENHGRSYNGANTIVDADHGRVGNFDGTNDYIDLGNPASLQITGDQTIAFWLKPFDFAARRNPFCKAYGGEGCITLETNGTVNYYYGTNGGNTTPYQAFTMTSALTADSWTHLAIVRDLSAPTPKLRWYKNGVMVLETNATYSAATAGSLAAYVGTGYVAPFKGQLEDMIIASRAFTTADIENLSQKLPTAYSDLDVLADTTYRYQVAAYNNDSFCRWATTHTTVVNATAGLGDPNPFSATTVNTTVINLGWNDSSEFEVDFELQRCTGSSGACGTSDGNYATIATPTRNTTAYTDSTVVQGTEYTYRIRTRSTNAPTWNSSWAYDSATATAIIAPSGLSATRVNEEDIALAWTIGTADEDGIEIQRCLNDSCTSFATIYTVSNGVNSYTNVGRQLNTSYTYRVRAFKNIGEANEWSTAWSNTDYATTTSYDPILATAATSTTEIALSWNDSTGRETDYLIQRCTGAGCVNFADYAAVGQGITEYTDTEVCNNTTYNYLVKAVNQGLTNGLLGTWTREKPLTITNFIPHYPLQIIIPYDADMQADFDDIRFWDNESEVEIPYVITSKTDSGGAVVWIITGDNNSIHLYYGNSQAISSSDAGLMDTIGASQYVEFYDTFNGSTLNTATWQLIGSAAYLYQNNGLIARGDNSGVWSYAVISKSTFNREVGKTLYFNALPQDNPAGTDTLMMGWELNQTANANYNQNEEAIYFNNFNFYNYTQGLGWDSAKDYVANYYYDAKIILKSLGADHYIAGGGGAQQFNTWTLLRSTSSYADDPLRIAVHQHNHHLEINWMMVFNPPAVEPGYSWGGEVASTYAFPDEWELYDSGVQQTTRIPAAPSDITATGISQTEIELTWTSNSMDEDGFVIEHCGGGNDSCMADPDNNFATLATKAGAPRLHLKMDEASWTGAAGEVVDSSGNDLHGTAVSGAAITSDSYSGNAANLTAAAYIQVADTPRLQFYENATFTVEGWFKPNVNVTAMANAYPLFIFKRPGAIGGWGGHFVKSTGKVNVQYCYNGGYITAESTTVFTAGNWYHYVGTMDGSNLKLYINGNLESTVAASQTMGSSAGTNLTIGQNFEGIIDEVIVFDHALTAAQVTDHYTNGMLKYVHQGLIPGSEHTYRLKVSKTGVTCGWGPLVSLPASDFTVSPPAPSSITLANDSTNHSLIKLAWTDNTSSNNSFVIERCTGTGCNTNDSLFEPLVTLQGNGLAYNDSTACPGTDYSYRIIGKNQSFAIGQNLSNAQNTEWARRKPLTITNFIANFQTRLTVAYDPDMQPDYDDLRFYDETAAVELNYWIESYDATSATVWLKTGANNNIRMYYGNPNATSSSNGETTFLFFDDFNDGSINTGKWTANSISYLSETGGHLKISRNYAAYLQSVNNLSNTSTGVITVRAKMVEASTYSYGWTPVSFRYNTGWKVDMTEVQSGSNNKMYYYNYNSSVYTANGSNAQPLDEWHQMSVVLRGNEIFDYVVEFEDSTNYNWSITNLGCNIDNRSGYRIYIGNGDTSSSGDLMDGRIDWVFMRSFNATTPTVALGSEETGPTFNWQTAYGNPAQANVTTTPPPAATNFTVSSQSDASLKLIWTDNMADDDGYVIERCQGSGCSNYAEVARTTSVGIFEDFNGDREDLSFWEPEMRLGGTASDLYLVSSSTPGTLTNKYGSVDTYVTEGKAILRATSTGLESGVCSADLSSNTLIYPNGICANWAMRRLGGEYTYNSTGILYGDFSVEVDFNIPSTGQDWTGGSGVIPIIIDIWYTNGGGFNTLAFFPNKGYVRAITQTSGGDVYNYFYTNQVYGAGKLKMTKVGNQTSYYFWESGAWKPVGQQTNLTNGTTTALNAFRIYSAAARDGVTDVTVELDEIRISRPTGSISHFIDDGYKNYIPPPEWDRVNCYIPAPNEANAYEAVPCSIASAAGLAEIYWNRNRGVLHTTAPANDSSNAMNQSYVWMDNDYMVAVGNDDFDFQIDYNLPNGIYTTNVGWGSYVRLLVHFSEWTKYIYTERVLSGGNNYYSGCINSGSGGSCVNEPTNDSSGRMRLTRVGDTLSTYFWNSTTDDWQLLKQVTASLGPDKPLMHAFIVQYNQRDGHAKDLEAEFYNLKLISSNDTVHINHGLVRNDSYNYRLYPYKDSGSCDTWSASATTMENNDSISVPIEYGTWSNWINHILGSTEVKLQWRDTTFTESGFMVERCTGAACDFSSPTIFYTEAGENIFEDTSLEHSTTYRYRVRAFHDLLGWYTNYQTWPVWDNSGWTITTLTPQAPTNLTTTWGSEVRVELAWTDTNFDETYYHIERSNDSCSTFSEIATVNSNITTYSDTTVMPATDYCYRVRAHKVATHEWYGPYSNDSTITTTISPPENLTAVQVNTTEIDLSWTNINESNTGVEIYRCEGSGCSVSGWILLDTVNDSISAYTDTRACDTTTYEYKLRPIRDLGSGDIWDSALYSIPDSAATSSANTPFNLSVSEIYNDSAENRHIDVTWSYDLFDETGFVIERCQSDNESCPTSFVAIPGGSILTNSGLPSWSAWDHGAYQPTSTLGDWFTTSTETVKDITKPVSWSLANSGSMTVTTSGDTASISSNCLHVPGGTYNVIYRTSVQTTDLASLGTGDFDVRIDYDLPNGLITSTNVEDRYIHFYLEMTDPNPADAIFPDYISIEYNAHYDRYDAVGKADSTTGSGTLTGITHTSATLRLTRISNKLAAWVDSGGGWQKVYETATLSHVSLPAKLRIYNQVYIVYNRNNIYNTVDVSNLSISTSSFTYTDTGLNDSANYIYRVRPYKNSFCAYDIGPYYTSEQVERTRPLGPTGFSASVLDGTLVKLLWTDNAVDEDGYKIEKYLWNGYWYPIHTTNDSNTVYANDSRSFITKIGNDWGKTYTYRVRAYQGDETSRPSNNDSVSLPTFQAGDDTCPPQ